jgi:hypothetical protein
MSQTGYTVERLIALEESIAEGALTVKYNGKEVTYRSLAEMNKIADTMRKALGLGCKKGKRGIFGGKRLEMKHSKDLG